MNSMQVKKAFAVKGEVNLDLAMPDNDLALVIQIASSFGVPFLVRPSGPHTVFVDGMADRDLADMLKNWASSHQDSDAERFLRAIKVNGARVSNEDAFVARMKSADDWRQFVIAIAMQGRVDGIRILAEDKESVERIATIAQQSGFSPNDSMALAANVQIDPSLRNAPVHLDDLIGALSEIRKIHGGSIPVFVEGTFGRARRPMLAMKGGERIVHIVG